LRRIIKLANLKEGAFNGLRVCAVIGFFDGVHRGHQEIIKKCVSSARLSGGVSVVFTFNKQPKNIIHKKLYKKLITASAEKLELIKKLGVDNIDEASDGMEAIQLSRKRTYNMIFMDIMMPKLDGLEAIRQIKPFSPDTKIIVCTSIFCIN
jgi:CheY-like chemotaxis protein